MHTHNTQFSDDIDSGIENGLLSSLSRCFNIKFVLNLKRCNRNRNTRILHLMYAVMCQNFISCRSMACRNNQEICEKRLKLVGID